MKPVPVWLDNHLSPALAAFIRETFARDCLQVRELGMARSDDREIFHAARASGAVLMSKDADFVDLVTRLGPPPAIIHLTCGNTSERRLKTLMAARLPQALSMIDGGGRLVEIGDRSEDSISASRGATGPRTS